MSTGAECHFYEKKNNGKREWFYDLQQWPYGEWPYYDTEGPFNTYKEALEHLHDYHANPGGHDVQGLGDCPHDLLAPITHDLFYDMCCDRCGAWRHKEKGWQR